jgi:hypothetical protein
MINERLLIIFTRNPILGKVKTRLAAAIGDEKALEVYETLRLHTANVAENVDAKKAVFFSGFIPSYDLLLGDGATACVQEGADLGERMQHAILSGFENGARHIVLIGTDCLELSAEILEEAFEALEGIEAVIGPARDGGFYLIGLNRTVPDLFTERQWSTPDVLRETVDILHYYNIQYKLLTELSDIDTFEDLKNSGLWTQQA